MKRLLIIFVAFFVFAACTKDQPEREEPQDVGLSRGVWDGNVFTSAYLGLRFTMPDGWSAAADDEMWDGVDLEAELYGLGIDPPDDMAMIRDLIIIYDMHAFNGATEANVQIAYERLLFPNADISEGEFIENLANVIQLMGGEIGRAFPETTKIGRYDWHAFEYSMSFGGVRFYVRYYVNNKDGFARLIILHYNEFSETVDELLGLFN
jgi:hypothetical protein